MIDMGLFITKSKKLMFDYVKEGKLNLSRDDIENKIKFTFNENGVGEIVRYGIINADLLSEDILNQIQKIWLRDFQTS